MMFYEKITLVQRYSKRMWMNVQDEPKQRSEV